MLQKKNTHIGGPVHIYRAFLYSHKRLFAVEPCLQLKRSLPRAGLEPRSELLKKTTLKSSFGILLKRI